MSPHPRPRFAIFAFGLITFDSVFQHGAVFFIVQMMDIGFIPAGKAAVTFHHWMARFGDDSGKHLTAVSLKLSAHQRDDVFVIPPAIRGTMQRNKPLAAGDVVQYRLRLSIFNAINVGIQHQPIELRQGFWREVFHAVGVLQIDPASFQRRGQLLKSSFRPMVPVVAHEQQLEISSAGGGTHRGKQQQCGNAK